MYSQEQVYKLEQDAILAQKKCNSAQNKEVVAKLAILVAAGIPLALVDTATIAIMSPYEINNRMKHRSGSKMWCFKQTVKNSHTWNSIISKYSLAGRLLTALAENNWSAKEEYDFHRKNKEYQLAKAQLNRYNDDVFLVIPNKTK